MPQIISIGLAVLFGFKDLFTSKTGKKDNGLQNIIIGIVVYFLVNRFLDQQAKDDILKNSANDPHATFAIRLHDALAPSGVDWLNSWFGDGTDEKTIQAIGSEMALTKCFVKVATSYKTIYGTDLSEDLRKDGVYDAFQVSYGTGSVSNGGTIATVIKKGDIVFTKGGYNLRSTNSPYAVTASTIANEDWIAYNSPYKNVIQGISDTWVVIQQPKSRYNLYPSYYVVSLSALYKK